MIRRHLLDNPHRVTLLLRPDTGHAQREEQAFAEHLRQIKAKLDEASDCRHQGEEHALKKSQETPDDTSCLPILDLTDIEVRRAWRLHSAGRANAAGETFWFSPTDQRHHLSEHAFRYRLPWRLSLRPYLPIFCALMPQIGAAGHDYLAMSRRITAATGGVRFGTNLLESPLDLDSMRPVVELKGKCLDRNQATLCEILTDILTKPDFDDLERLRTVIGQIRTSMENSIPGAGHSFASRAAAATLTPTASSTRRVERYDPGDKRFNRSATLTMMVC